MTLQQLAKYLHMGERTVLKLATSKKLPGSFEERRWIFDRGQIDGWLEQQATDDDFQDVPDGMRLPLGDLLPQEGLVHDMAATSAMVAIEELAGTAYRNHWLSDREWLVTGLVEREGLASTAMDGGVAFLHTRSRDQDKIKRPFIVCGRSYTGIDFGAPDGKKTYLFFLLGLKYDKLHLPILGRLARVMKVRKNVAKLRSTTSPLKMRATLIQLDSEALNLRTPLPTTVVDEPKLDRELRLRTIMRINARRRYDARKTEEASQAAAAKLAVKEAKKAAAKKIAAEKAAVKKIAAEKVAAKKAVAAEKAAAKKAATAEKAAAKKAAAAEKAAAKKAAAAAKKSSTTTKKAAAKKSSTTTKKAAAKKTSTATKKTAAKKTSTATKKVAAKKSSTATKKPAAKKTAAAKSKK